MKQTRRMPPRLFLRFFRWYCHPRLADHIEGDLLEEYQSRVRSFGKRRADLQFIIDVILLVRPAIVGRPHFQNQNTLGMYRSFFIIGWRNLLRNSGYSLINIGGLAIGMAVAILNALWIWDEVSFNHYHDNYPRIGQVTETGMHEGKRFVSSTMTYPLCTELIENYGSNFRRIARATFQTGPILSAGDKKINSLGRYTDPSFPEMFTFRMLHGSRSALKGMSIFLSASVAKSLFGHDNPLNKVVRINNSQDATVTGVYEDFPANTQFSDLKFFGSWQLWLAENKWVEERALNDWRNHFLKLYVELHNETAFGQTAAQINPALRFDPADAEQAKMMGKKIYLYPMADWHLYSYDRGFLNKEPVRMIQMVGAIGLFILLLACINFMNLSTARSEKRAKEVGIRKTIGSLRSQLINQFFTESFLIACFAFIVALALVSACLQPFNELAGKGITLPLTNAYFWLAAAIFIAITSVLAGSYPAVYLSSFNPARTLKGRIRTGRFAATPRKVLVVSQFSISVILIICTAVVYQQIQFAKNRPVGYNREGLLMIEKKSGDFYGKYEVLRTELKNTGAVEEVSESMGPVTEVVSGNGGWEWRERNPATNNNFVTHAVSATHGKTAGWQFVDGRDFDINNFGDSSGIVVNEAAAKVMSLKNPVGEMLSWTWWQDGRVLNYKIIGVIRNMVMDSPYDPAEPTVFYLKGFNGTTNWINIRLHPQVSMGEALRKIEGVFKKVIPAAPFEYKFADEEYARKFASEERVGKLAFVFATLAIFISCLGLFGLASFVAEQRTKEIGIRKVLGATLTNVWRLLSKDFIVLVLLACTLSAPIAYYLMDGWLLKYNYRVDMTAWTFLATCAGAILLTLVTVSFQAVRAGVANPVNSLRSE